MKYALLIYPKPGSHEELPEAEYRQVNAEYLAIRDEDGVVGGAHLEGPDSSTTVRVSDGETLVTDGPFAATKEVVGGFYLLEAPDIDAALAVAARIPAARLGGAVEVRPVVGQS